MAVYPGVNLSEAEVSTMVDYAIRIGRRLNVIGLFNIQFIFMPNSDGHGSTVYVLEVNSRASRTVHFISKVTGVPMVNVATKVMLGHSLNKQGYFTGLWPKQKLFAIKAPVFSMGKLTGVDTYLGPEMKSTGEVMGIDHTFESALAKALISSGMMLAPTGGVLISVADRDKPEALPIIRKLSQLGYQLYATEGTAAMIEAAGMKVNLTTKKLHEGHPNVVDVVVDGSVNAVINTVTGGRIPLRDGFQIRRTACERRVPCFTSLDTARAAVQALVNGSQNYTIKPINEYRNKDNPVVDE
jgi:carbamoyl-phosphate synthase large subunit